MANDGEFQEQIRQMGKLVADFDRLPDDPAKDAGKKLLQLLMDIHGAGLERMLEIVFESGDAGPKIIDRLGQDSVTSSLLLLYSLHPDDLETRVQKAVERMRPRLRKLACAVELVSVREDAVQVRLAVSGHNCGSSTKDLRAIVEDHVYEFAPDVMSLEILGLEEPSPAGFVSLESLVGHGLPAYAANGAAAAGRPRESDGAD